MGDNGFDTLEIHIRRRLSFGEDKDRVKNVQALIFHRAEIEITHSDNHEAVEVIFPAKSLFVPFHRALEGVHRIFGLFRIAGVYEN